MKTSLSRGRLFGKFCRQPQKISGNLSRFDISHKMAINLRFQRQIRKKKHHLVKWRCDITDSKKRRIFGSWHESISVQTKRYNSKSFVIESQLFERNGVKFSHLLVNVSKPHLNGITFYDFHARGHKWVRIFLDSLSTITPHCPIGRTIDRVLEVV